MLTLANVFPHITVQTTTGGGDYPALVISCEDMPNLTQSELVTTGGDGRKMIMELLTAMADALGATAEQHENMQFAYTDGFDSVRSQIVRQFSGTARLAVGALDVAAETTTTTTTTTTT